MGTGAGTSRSFDGILGSGFLAGTIPEPAAVFPESFQPSLLIKAEAWAAPAWRQITHQNGTSEFSTDPAANFHFSLARE